MEFIFHEEQELVSPELSLTGLELISHTYFELFLAQLLKKAYSTFVLKGELPDCEANQLLKIIQVQQMDRPKLIGEKLALLKDSRIRLWNKCTVLIKIRKF
uniref:Uncharacterized protein n=1 Tax=Monodelphis domestica TaxID=13616 RepID=A0A5F8GBH4_MONDO